MGVYTCVLVRERERGDRREVRGGKRKGDRREGRGEGVKWELFKNDIFLGQNTFRLYTHKDGLKHLSFQSEFCQEKRRS